MADEIERQASAARADAEAAALEAQQALPMSFAETGEALEQQAEELAAQVEALEAERDRTAGRARFGTVRG
ncbi:hypothetical protein ACRHM7_17945 [Chromohalobacter israelensis]|uniref:hypothetical protein n=1 Tax=Chromohalobacter israelensis TaxID=141390 RepID=UPI003D7AFF8C